MLHVVRGLRPLREPDVAFDDDLFGFARPATQAQARGDGSRVHDAAASHRGFLGVLHEDFADVGAHREDAGHHAGGGDAIAVVGKSDGTGAGEQLELGELFAPAASGGGGNREDAAGGSVGAVVNEADEFWGVERGRRVGHAADGGEPARCSRERAGFDGFFVLLAGLAEVDVGVDESGNNEAALGIDHPIGGGAVEAVSDGRDKLAGNGDVSGFVEAGFGVEDAAAGDEKSAHGWRGYRMRPIVVTNSVPGYSAAWLARLTGGQKVGGSNPPTPI